MLDLQAPLWATYFDLRLLVESVVCPAKGLPFSNILQYQLAVGSEKNKGTSGCYLNN